MGSQAPLLLDRPFLPGQKALHPGSGTGRRHLAPRPGLALCLSSYPIHRLNRVFADAGALCACVAQGFSFFFEPQAAVFPVIVSTALLDYSPPGITSQRPAQDLAPPKTIVSITPVQCRLCQCALFSGKFPFLLGRVPLSSPLPHQYVPWNWHL